VQINLTPLLVLKSTQLQNKINEFKRLENQIITFSIVAIRMVAKNDTNKRTVVTHGALPSLVLLANEPKNAEEQKG